MKNVLFILTLLTISICSCNNSTKQQLQNNAEKERLDSILRAKLKAQEIENEKLAWEDSIAIYAWEDVKFGMTKKEVLQTKAFTGSSKYDNSFSMDSDKEFALIRFLGLSRILNIWVDFGGKTDNEAIRIRMDASAGWKDFTELIGDMQRLIDMFTSEFGKPDEKFEHISSLRYRDLDQNKNIMIAHWIIGSGVGKNGIKHIKIYASTYTDSSYQYKVDIYNSDFPKQTK